MVVPRPTIWEEKGQGRGSVPPGPSTPLARLDWRPCGGDGGGLFDLTQPPSKLPQMRRD